MFFRTLISIFILISLSACSWWGGEVKSTRVVELKEEQVLGASSGCLNDFESTFSMYFKGQARESDISQTFSCIQDLSGKIFEHAEEKSIETGFTREEMEVVFNSTFPKMDRKDVEDHIDLLFITKRLLIGGGENTFKRSEKKNFDVALREISNVFISSRDSVHFLFLKNEQNLNSRDKHFSLVEESFSKLDEIRSKFGGVINSNEALKIIDHIFKEKFSISKLKNLALIAKDFLFGPSKDFHNVQQDFFTRIFYVLEVQARFRVIDFSDGFLVGETFYDLQRALEIISKKLKLWSTESQGYSLNVERVKDLVIALHEVGVMRSYFADPGFVARTVESVLLKIFKTREFDSKSMNKFDTIVSNWISRQSRIISKYRFPWAIGRFDGLERESRSILEEIRSFRKPQFTTGKAQPILIRRDTESVLDTVAYFDSSLKHTLYTLVLEFFKAYTKPDISTERITNNLSLNFESVKEVFIDIRPLALEMGFVDPNSCGSERRAFIEADFLMRNSNGDNRLNINEVVEWIGTMISVGSISKHMFDRLSKSCLIPGMTMLSSQYAKRSCAMEELFGRTSVLSSYFPSMQAYLELLENEGQREEFRSKLKGVFSYFIGFDAIDSDSISNVFQNTFNTCGQEDFPFNRGELNSVVAVLTYIENLFSQFDKTGLKGVWSKDDPKGSDFILDAQELLEVSKERPHYRQLLLSYLKKDKSNSEKTLDRWRSEGVENALSILERLPDTAVKIDRITAISDILNPILKGAGGLVSQNLHRFKQNYCSDIYTSFQRGSISYDPSERLMCTEEDL